MKIALTTNLLFVPPLYFAINHAEKLSAHHEFEMFALLADIKDSSVTVPIHDFAALPQLSRPQRTLLAPFAAHRMGLAVEQFGADVIHQHFATWSGPALAAAKRGSTPLLTTLHGYDVWVTTGTSRSPMSLWHRHNIRGIQRSSDRVLAVSRYLADEAIRGGFAPARLEVHYQGIDTDYFTPSVVDSPRGASSANNETPVVAFVGALKTQKGVLDLIKASFKALSAFDHRLVVIGTGPLEARVRELALAHPHIDFRGAAPREAVRETMRRAAVLVVPSQEYNGWREAAGLVLLEAQACGTPVIAYDNGGIPEMLLPGVTGILVPERSIDGLTAAIRDVLSMESVELAGMGRAAREFVVSNRSLAISCDELEAHYEEISS